MKQLGVFIICISLFLQSCGNSSKAAKEDYRSQVLIERNFIQNQLDSLCLADTLSTNLHDWLNAELVSYSTNDTIFKHVWIKQWGDGTLVKYVVTGMTEPFLVEKTKTYKIDKK